MNTVAMPNNGPVNSITPSLYFPRLQVNSRGEIVLATSKDGSLTTGILVGKTPTSKSTLPLGIKLEDWEVCGELKDFDGAVNITLQQCLHPSHRCVVIQSLTNAERNA